MSRGSRDDDRTEPTDRAPERQARDQPRSRAEDVAARDFALPRGEAREVVQFRGREYALNGSETRALATVGAFRVVSPGDVGDGAHGEDARHGDWRHLTEQGLLTRDTITDEHGSRHVVALTPEGKDLLDAHARDRPDGSRQEYYADIVKPRELNHDSQIYRLYREEAAAIEAEGGRITRLVLDYELKRDYQEFLNRDDRDDDLDQDRLAFAKAHDLPVIDGHLELPDLRIEYETEDGRIAYRDVELVTEHYSRGQLSGKTTAGFACYRASSGGGRKGGTPFNPRHLERMG